MKKIIFSLHLGLIGQEDSGKKILLGYLGKESIPINAMENDTNQEEFQKFIVVYEGIPIKIKVYQTSDLNSFMNNHKFINNVDVLLLVLNLYHLNSKNEYRKDDLERFIKLFSFKGISGLIGFDVEQFQKGNRSSDFRISRYNLIQKVKELDLMYCFEIKDDIKDVKELYQILLNDYIFKLKISNPELLDKAREYGNELTKLRAN